MNKSVFESESIGIFFMMSRTIKGNKHHSKEMEQNFRTNKPNYGTFNVNPKNDFANCT